MTEREKLIRTTHEKAYKVGYEIGHAQGQQMAFAAVMHLRHLLDANDLNGEQVDVGALLAELEKLRTKPNDIDGALDKIAELQKQNQELLERINKYESERTFGPSHITSYVELDIPELQPGMVLPDGYYVLSYGAFVKDGDIRLKADGKYDIVYTSKELPTIWQQEKMVKFFGRIYARKKEQQ